MSVIDELKKAKRYSDIKDYDKKHQLVYQVVVQQPDQFFIDSDDGKGIVGVTHSSSGFQIHVPSSVLKDVKLETKLSAASPAMRPGTGMPVIAGGGTGSYSKLPSLSGIMKSKLTTATKQVGDKAKSEQVADPRTSLYPETMKYYANKNNPQKTAGFTTGSISRVLGYSPGVWYDEGRFSPDAQTRMGNLVSGIGLAGAGLLSIPILQKLFPERFKDKDIPLAVGSVLGGLIAPWALNAPSTIADFNRFMQMDDESWKAIKDDTITTMRTRSGIDPTHTEKESSVTGVSSDLNSLVGATKKADPFGFNIPSGPMQRDTGRFRRIDPNTVANAGLPTGVQNEAPMPRPRNSLDVLESQIPQMGQDTFNLGNFNPNPFASNLDSMIADLRRDAGLSQQQAPADMYADEGFLQTFGSGNPEYYPDELTETHRDIYRHSPNHNIFGNRPIEMPSSFDSLNLGPAISQYNNPTQGWSDTWLDAAQRNPDMFSSSSIPPIEPPAPVRDTGIFRRIDPREQAAQQQQQARERMEQQQQQAREFMEQQQQQAREFMERQRNLPATGQAQNTSFGFGQSPPTIFDSYPGSQNNRGGVPQGAGAVGGFGTPSAPAANRRQGRGRGRNRGQGRNRAAAPSPAGNVIMMPPGNNSYFTDDADPELAAMERELDSFDPLMENAPQGSRFSSSTSRIAYPGAIYGGQGPVAQQQAAQMMNQGMQGARGGAGVTANNSTPTTTPLSSSSYYNPAFDPNRNGAPTANNQTPSYDPLNPPGSGVFGGSGASNPTPSYDPLNPPGSGVFGGSGASNPTPSGRTPIAQRADNNWRNNLPQPQPQPTPSVPSGFSPVNIGASNNAAQPAPQPAAAAPIPSMTPTDTAAFRQAIAQRRMELWKDQRQNDRSLRLRDVQLSPEEMSQITGRFKSSSYIPMDLQIAKTHLADVLSEQMRSGFVDYGQAAGLMARAARENNQPWITVGGLARAAVGAGAGALAGSVAAKGIGLFMNISPKEQKFMQGTGAALGTLINLGKLGI